MRALFARLSLEKAQVYGLILASADISHQIQRRGSKWAVTVSAHHRAAAIKAVALYLSENPSPQLSKRPPVAPVVKTYSAVYVVPFLALIHWAVSPGYERQVFVEIFGADAAKMVSGDLYRSITALLLHKDWAHVINNMAAMALFGTVVASICGWGMGWFMILLTGAAGNMATAMWYRHGHVAIGASTAVFGALGICVALNLWRHARIPQSSWRMWLPLAGGLALLGFLGGSPHSDLMAHLSGFGSGLIIGAGYGWKYKEPPGFTVQLAAAIAGVGMIVACWSFGVYGAS